MRPMAGKIKSIRQSLRKLEEETGTHLDRRLEEIELHEKAGHPRAARALRILKSLEDMEDLWRETVADSKSDFALICSSQGYTMMIGRFKEGYQGYFWENISGIHRDVCGAISIGIDNYEKEVYGNGEKKNAE